MADTKLTIKQIELSLYNSPWFDKRGDIMIPNLSWGLLNHEADFCIINKTHHLTEIEIKRSFSDFKADFKKNEFHKDEKIYRFFYCVPEKIYDKVVNFMAEEAQVKKFVDTYGLYYRKPGILTYDELGNITMTNYSTGYTGYGRKLFLEEMVKIGRYMSLRYWSAINKFVGMPKIEENQEDSKEIL